MLLARKRFTLGNTTRYQVSYKRWLKDGTWITSATVTASATDVTISGKTIVEGNSVVFYVAGASINEAFTVTLVISTSNSEVVTDTIDYITVAP